MYDVIINFELQTAEGAVIPVTHVLQELRALGVQKYPAAVYGTTLSVGLFGDQAHDANIAKLASAFNVEQVPVWDMLHREGRVVTPDPHSPAGFRAETFYLANGSLLSEARSAA